MKKYYYVYMLREKFTNEFYIGSRGTNNNPKVDKYMGSPYTWKPNKENLIKEIIKDDFKNREEAINFERELIIKNITHSLNRNYSIPNIKCFREGLITSKTNEGKIITISINDPLFGIKFFGVTKGKTRVRDKEGNVFITETNNPEYLNGNLIHANKGLIIGDNHPNKNKIRINKQGKEKFIFDYEKKTYLDKGWVLGTSQKGKTNQHKGTIWVHNKSTKKTKRINIIEREKYLQLGWELNRLKLGNYEKRKKRKERV